MHKMRLGIAAAAVALMLPVAARGSAVQPYRFNDYAQGGIHDILPAGENGLVNAAQLLAYELNSSNRPPHSNDQYGMYQNLLYGYHGLTAADIPKYYKDSSFGVRPDDIASEVSPRPDVTIVRDKGFGVPHVYGTTRAGTMFGAGYAAAQDKLFFMDVLRHAGRGKLSGFAGGSNAGMDASTFASAPYSEADMQAQIDNLPKLYGAEGQQVVDDGTSFVAGVNQYIAEAKIDPTKMPAEYAAIGRPLGPDPWTATDLVSEASLIGGQLGKGGGNQLTWAQILENFQHKYGPGVGTTLWNDWRARNDPEAPTTVLGKRFPYEQPPANPAPGSAAMPDFGSVTPQNNVTGGSVAGALSGAQRAPSAPATGALVNIGRGLLRLPHSDSNALLVAARHSASGHPLAVMGPQVFYFNPEILMDEDLHGPGIDARGAAFDGVNLYVELGHGRDYAWSATSAGQDIIHVFAVPLCNPDGSPPAKSSNYYLFRGQCTAMSAVSQTNSWTPNPADTTPAGSQTVTIERTALGPVIARATIGGQPVAYTQLRSTYFHELDSALGFYEFNNPNIVHDARSFQHAAYKIGYTFNWMYADNRDIAYFNSGANPAANPRVDPILPVSSKFEWQNFNPNGNTASYTSFAQHPQTINQDYLVSWNNKQAPAYSASDSYYGPVYRSQLLSDRIQAAIANGHKMTLPELISAMEDAGTVDLRGYKDLPLILQVLGQPSDPALAQAVQDLQAWLADGAHRIDPTQSGSYQHSRAIAIMDAWWPLLVQGEFQGSLGKTLYDEITSQLSIDDPPNHGSGVPHAGSAYDTGWFGYVNKDMRQILGQPVAQPNHGVYCGAGDINACRAMLTSTLGQAVAAASNPQTLYQDSACSNGDQACFDSIVFRPIGAVSQPHMPWVNRPTYQQAVEIPTHRPRP